MGVKPFDVVALSALNFDYVVTGGNATEDTERVCPRADILTAIRKPNHGEVPSPTCGGSAFNALTMLAKLDEGLKLGLIAVEPSMPVTEAHSHVRKAESMHVHFLGTSLTNADPGVCGSIASPNGRQLLVDPGCNTRIGEALTDELLSRLKGTRILHVSSFFEEIGATDEPVAEAIADFVHAFKAQNPLAVVSIDPGHPWTERIGSHHVRRIIAAADILFLNRTEFGTLTKGPPESGSVQRLRELAPNVVPPESWRVLYAASGMVAAAVS